MKNKRSIKFLCISSTTAVLLGCASPAPLTNAQRIALQPIICSGKAQCDLLWQRTQLWIARNSGYRIQTANDVLIQTYGPFNAKVELAYRAFREPMSNGKAKISFSALCDNWIGCERPPIDAITDLRAYVIAGAVEADAQTSPAQ